MVETAKQATKEIPSFAFVGGFGSGKSYYSERLQVMMEQELGVPIYRVHIAAKLKEIAVDLFHMEGKDRKLTNAISAAMRGIDPNVWPNYLVEDIKKHGKQPFIIDDMRFMNDASVLRANFPNLIIVRLETVEEQRMAAFEKRYGRRPKQEELSDPTEADIPFLRADITLRNEYKPETTTAQLHGIVEGIKGGTLLRREPPQAVPS